MGLPAAPAHRAHRQPRPGRARGGDHRRHAAGVACPRDQPAARHLRPAGRRGGGAPAPVAPPHELRVEGPRLLRRRRRRGRGRGGRRVDLSRPDPGLRGHHAGTCPSTRSCSTGAWWTASRSPPTTGRSTAGGSRPGWWDRSRAGPEPSGGDPPDGAGAWAVTPGTRDHRRCHACTPGRHPALLPRHRRAHRRRAAALGLVAAGVRRARLPRPPDRRPPTVGAVPAGGRGGARPVRALAGLDDRHDRSRATSSRPSPTPRCSGWR